MSEENDKKLLAVNMSSLGMAFGWKMMQDKMWAETPWYKKAAIITKRFVKRKTDRLHTFLFKTLFPKKYAEIEEYELRFSEMDFDE